MSPESSHSLRHAQYSELHNPLSSSSSGQARRRQDALDRQRQQRQQAFSLTREGLDAVLDDLNIDSSEEEEDLQTKVVDDARSSNVASTEEETMEVEGSSSRPRRKTNKPTREIKKKWKGYANRLMYGEDLDLAEGLPADLEYEWLALGPIPEGKRCMAVTFHGTRMNRKGRVTNTLLLSRLSGRPLSRHLIPALPPDCILDCVYSEDNCALFVLDVLRWKSQSLAETEAEFRMFWRDSKLSEFPPQSLPPQLPEPPEDANQLGHASAPRHGRRKPAQLLVVPIPCHASPLSRTALHQVLEHCANREKMAFSVLLSSKDPALGQPSVQQMQIAMRINGLLLLVKSASYESGLTPLAAWIGKDVFPQFSQLLMSSSVL